MGRKRAVCDGLALHVSVQSQISLKSCEKRGSQGVVNRQECVIFASFIFCFDARNGTHKNLSHDLGNLKISYMMTHPHTKTAATHPTPIAASSPALCLLPRYLCP